MTTPPSFSSESWKRVKQLTADALERPAEERDAWLAVQYAGNEALRREVESLLVADARAGRFLQGSALDSDGAADVVKSVARESLGLIAGRRIGPYEIIRELGHGGMGVVYLAARADLAFEKQVAVKVVRAGAATDLVRQRFHAERRILATLDHPYIARLLDAGVTTDGLSYFVMEYVDGVPFDAYCKAAGLALKQRLSLFRHVCGAVQYAHHRLVIHRDIKPGNILVTSEGSPKLLDFGIAKLLDPEIQSGQTVTGRAFTLEYASPEQIRGEPMSVTSDVYALGVLLYQLIAGHRPCGATAVADTDLMRAICDEPPARPSLAAQTGTGFAVSAELEWIVLKALRKEPDRRYESVDRLTDDLDRLASGRPVLAGPDSRRYRASKFMTRHRFAVAAGVLLAASLVGGMTTTLWQARRANEQRARAELRFQNARRLANAMVFELNDAIELGATSARALLLTRASEQLDALALDSPDDPILAEELATAYHRLADAQGRPGSANLGDSAAALVNHRKALAIRRQIADRSPGDLEARSRLVLSLNDTAAAEDDDRALELAQSAVATAESLRDAGATDVRFERARAAAHYALGSQLVGSGDHGRARTSFESAFAIYQAIHDGGLGDAEVRRSLALCHKRLGAIIAVEEPAKAIVHMRRAVELDEAGVADLPASPQRRRDLSTSNIQLGYALMRTGDSTGALAAYRLALRLRGDLLRDDSNDVQARRDLASVLWYIGDLQNQVSPPLEAIASFERALALAPGATYMSGLIRSGLADALKNLGRLDETVQMRKQALDTFGVLLAKTPAASNVLQSVVRDQRLLGDSLMQFAQRAPDGAVRAARRRDACAAYDEGLRAGGTLSANGTLGSAEQSEIDALRKGRGRCRP